MKLTTLALASAFALSTIALANAAPKPEVKNPSPYRPAMVQFASELRQSENGDPDGSDHVERQPASSQFGGSSPGTSGRN